MFGRNKKKLEALEEQIRLLQNWNTRSSSESEYLAKRISMLENPAKYVIGLKIIDRYIITERRYQTGRYIANLQTLNYSHVVGWDYIVFDIKDNKHTTLCEDQITNLIEDGKTVQKKA